ncbi:choice-of-anchor M domain-containing protein [Dactylosporangium sp. NPDC000521]|uniref:choice-of-anchor M domain-containing protein n=1 Tax=Dactylosporangium sp. NPDC000521 TaxID=3363975 RepID=UPI003684256F
MRVRIPLLGAATTALTVALLAVGTPAQAAGVVLSQGHVDAVDVAFEDGAFELSVHDETVDPDVERDPASVVFKVPSQAAVTVPADPAYAFLGSPGSTVYVLPEVQDPALLWAGLATEELEPGVFAGDSVRIRFRQVLGPDGFSLFATDPAGAPLVAVDSENGLPDIVTLPVATHAHYNWAFERPGTYRIKVDVTARLASTGVTVTSDPVWLKFVVCA